MLACSKSKTLNYWTMELRDRAFDNRMLRMLPRAEFTQLISDMHFLHWDLNDTIYDVDAPFDHIYFPLSAVTSNIVMMENGGAVETSTVGREGVVGGLAALGSDRSAIKVICQIPGDAARLGLDDFKKHFEALPQFQELITRFNALLLNTISQTAACNRLHHLNERLARWLLMTHDRVSGDTLSLTQDFLAAMLGVNRPFGDDCGPRVAGGRLDHLPSAHDHGQESRRTRGSFLHMLRGRCTRIGTADPGRRSARLIGSGRQGNIG